MNRLWIILLLAIVFAPKSAFSCPYGEISIKVLVAHGHGEVRTNKGAEACHGEGNAIWRAEYLFEQSKKAEESACAASGGHADWTEGVRHQPDLDICKYGFGGTTAIFWHMVSQTGDCCRPKESSAPLLFPPSDLKSDSTCSFSYGAEWHTVFGEIKRVDAKKATCALAMKATNNALSVATEAAEKRCIIDPATGNPKGNVKFVTRNGYNFDKCSPPESSFGNVWSHTRGIEFLCCEKKPLDATHAPPPDTNPPPYKP